MTFTEIDNPGKGNCAFYGFAIGLIDIIKHQYARDGESDVFNQLSYFDELDLELAQIIDFNYQAKSDDVLEKMQRHLRRILFGYRKLQLTANKDHPEETYAYNKFCELVQKSANGRTTDSRYNELAKSKELKVYVESHAQQVSTIVKNYPSFNSDEIEAVRSELEGIQLIQQADDLKEFEQALAQTYRDLQQARIHYLESILECSRQKDATINKILKEGFLNDVYVPAQEVELNQESLVIAALSDVTQQFRWGTQSDLKELAEFFNINLHTLENGRNPYEPENKEGRPILTINNKFNNHWTTCLSFLGPGFGGKQYAQFTQDSVISKQEIKAIMQTYTTGFKSVFTPRHHKKQANAIIKQCDTGSCDVKDVVQMFESYLDENKDKFTKNSSFKKRADYILARAEAYTEALKGELSK